MIFLTEQNPKGTYIKYVGITQKEVLLRLVILIKWLWGGDKGQKGEKQIQFKEFQ